MGRAKLEANLRRARNEARRIAGGRAYVQFSSSARCCWFRYPRQLSIGGGHLKEPPEMTFLGFNLVTPVTFPVQIKR
jgi:hypothetical protein